MDDREPTVRSRELGEGLRLVMQRAGFTGSEMARQLDWSQSKISRLLSGKRGGSGYDVSAFLAVCGVKGAERDRLMSLTVERDRKGWLQQHGPMLPKQVRTLIDHETNAVSIGHFQSTLVPGLLQTGDYARAVIEGSGAVPDNEVEDRVSARLARQSLLSRRYPPHCTFFLHEFVLRLPAGGPVVMSEQLHHLLRMSVRPKISLRVVPTSVGAHAGTAGPFTLLDVADFKPIVYLDSQTSCLFLESPVEIDAYRDILARLESTALGEGESRELIATAATELYSDGDDDHD
ncbi:helix-turn-helix transcriptional regulator [Haloechinothrix sp. LS1_15]|uniref:helix-turn-helix domain-containing protein n=1 Tax=Haloechinothrix sp. LS1_15 TaxID=2652248 RepID=UPI00294636F5|nr:helix-turn-helix transcriptional regulator [Haloechinothrix sp. LS1_15]MDV6014709.1 helix-turn-helix domain-containing protein [Haloechinothrix sp. LS1_15]